MKPYKKVADVICFIANFITLIVMLLCTTTRTTSPVLITAFLTMIFVNIVSIKLSIED